MLFKYEKSKAAEAFARRAGQGGGMPFEMPFVHFLRFNISIIHGRKRAIY